MCNLINLPTYIHIYIHTYIHTCIHTYIHTYIRISARNRKIVLDAVRETGDTRVDGKKM